MKYQVKIKRRILRSVEKMPKPEQMKLALLIDDLANTGPTQAFWPNFSKLSATEYHCHLSRKWVACWRHEKGTIEIEVYYAGSREDAPY
jgi:mRNA-degrading endonuclease RelE of RelBE toxin-antitoxin system